MCNCVMCNVIIVSSFIKLMIFSTVENGTKKILASTYSLNSALFNKPVFIF